MKLHISTDGILRDPKHMDVLLDGEQLTCNSIHIDIDPDQIQFVVNTMLWVGGSQGFLDKPRKFVALPGEQPTITGTVRPFHITCEVEECVLEQQ